MENIILDFLSKYDNAVSYISLLVSIITLCVMLGIEKKRKFNLKIDYSDVYLFPSIDTSSGNKYSITFIVRVMNRSCEQLQLTDIQLLYNDFSVSCVHDCVDHFVHIPNGDGYSTVDFNNCIEKLPFVIPAYCEYSSRVLITLGGSNYLNDLNKKKIRFVTSRGNKTIAIKVPSERYQNQFFR